MQVSGSLMPAATPARVRVKARAVARVAVPSSIATRAATVQTPSWKRSARAVNAPLSP
jgi:hypothetical protein